MTSHLKIFEIFFALFLHFEQFYIIYNWKKILKFLEVTVTWSDEQMVESLEVTVTSQVTVTWKEVTVIPSSDDQMVEANAKGDTFVCK